MTATTTPAARVNVFVGSGRKVHVAYTAHNGQASTVCGAERRGVGVTYTRKTDAAVTCLACAPTTAEVPAAKKVSAAAAVRDEVTATVATPRFVAIRELGRYRVIDADAPAGSDARYVAVAASRAKAEEKAAKLNEEATADLSAAVPAPPLSRRASERRFTAAELDAADAAKVAAENASRSASLLDENGHLPEFAEPMTEEEAEEVAVALLGPARGAAAVAPAPAAAPRPADKLLTVWVGWSVVDLVVPRVGDADPDVASVARKLQERKPDSAKARTIRVTAAEREALSALATAIETEAVTAGAGALARSARALRGRLA